MQLIKLFIITGSQESLSAERQPPATPSLSNGNKVGVGSSPLLLAPCREGVPPSFRGGGGGAMAVCDGT